MIEIKINHDYHIVELNRTASIADTVMWNWLKDRFGEGDGSRWFYRHPKLFFLNKQDHLMFVLRWS